MNDLLEGTGESRGGTDPSGRRRPAMARWFGLALLAGAVLAGPPARAAAAISPCSVTTLAVLPLSLRNGHYLTVAQINGTPVEMLVDTGAAVSTIDPRVARTLRLEADRRRRSTIIGAGGTSTASAASVTARSFDLEGLHLGPVTLLANTLAALGTAPSGLIGADLLARFDVEFDPSRGRLVLHGVTGCSGHFIDWSEPAEAVPLQHFFDGRLKTATVAVNGIDLPALVDTGSTQTVLFTQGARRLGAAATRSGTDRTGFGLGAVPGQRITMFAHRFASLRLGSETLADPQLIVANGNPLGVQMILGLDILARRRIWLSYATDQMFVSARPVASPQYPP